jgi:Putative esterase
VIRRSNPLQSATPIYDRRCRHITFFSPALGINKSFYIFVPPDLTDGQSVPALYLLRGHEREWINTQEDSSRGGKNVIDVYERLRAVGHLGPLILVFPGMTSDDNRVPTLLVNMCAPQLTSASGIGSGRFEDYFFQDLIPYVDAHFPTIADRRRRGVAGFSLGGAMAIKAVAQRPELFATASAYDGTFLYAIAGGQRVRANDPVLRNPMFDPAYDVPRNMPFIAGISASNLIMRGDATTLSRVTWLIGYGSEQLEPWHANFYRGEHLVRCLRARGIDNALPRAGFPGGNHTWRTADEFMAVTLPLHDLVFRH